MVATPVTGVAGTRLSRPAPSTSGARSPGVNPHTRATGRVAVCGRPTLRQSYGSHTDVFRCRCSEVEEAAPVGGEVDEEDDFFAEARARLAALEARISGFTYEIDVPMGRLVVAPVARADTKGSSVLLTRAFAGTPEGIYLSDISEYLENMLVAPPDAVLLVARLYPNDLSLNPPGQDSRVVGTVALSFTEDTREEFTSLQPPDDACYLSNMAVDAKFRRNGIAAILMQQCEAVTLLAGLNNITLHVSKANEPACALYNATGYSEIDADSFLVFLQNTRPRRLMAKTLS